MQVDLRRRGLQSFDPAEFANTDEHLHLLLQVRQLDLSHNSLYTIRGLEGLTHLTVLNVSHNGLRSLGGGLPLTLRELDASHNNLASLQNAALLPLQSLTSLNVSFNDLEDLRGVPNVTAQLTYLDVRCNRLGSLIGIEHCGQLRTLHAEGNLLRELADVASLKSLSLLSAVFLSGNPLLLRKRLLTQLHLLLPSSVEQDDLPTTAPPSSVRSSTAAPPSVADTSSVGSLDHSTMASVGENRKEGRCGSGQNSRPVSAHQGTVLSMRDTTGMRDSSETLERTAPRHDHPSSPRSHHRLPHRGTSDSARPSYLSAAAPTTTTASAASTGVVGGSSDSLACPRRALPHEHRLTETPGSASLSSSPDRTHVSWSPGPLHSSNGRGSLTTSLFPGAASSPHQYGAVVAAPQATRYGESHSSQLVRDDLEEQLVRVTAERDDYRREVVALRRELQELRLKFARQCSQERAEDREGLAQASLRSAAAAPGHGEGDSRGAHRMPRHPQQQQQQQRSPSVRILAVEMSAHSSLCSQDGESDTPDASSNDLRSAPQNSAAMSNSVGTSKMDRREIAALFMTKLQQSSSSSK
ncbi:hypothetical protein, conserved [Leishmania donovani]|uniref:Uncharacterized protein n=1 Tax=Leishmania donovani TaxID=5661 RepID=E9BAN2_LEIDO|nr:hypothetical protein, conserved [Leishmania donovani]CBZ32307.1 hypothetical protein, conserved [Leishmania donovani]